MEREVLVRPVLTAWMDTASGCIVGWVISILPNSSTIAEAFCRACVYTLDKEFPGLHSSILVDCGKDYRSALLEDFPEDLKDSVPEDGCLNRRFASLVLLPSLNITVRHALPYHPQSKSIERLFGTPESRWISKLPSWCRNSAAARPAGFDRTLKNSGRTVPFTPWKNSPHTLPRKYCRNTMGPGRQRCSEHPYPPFPGNGQPLSGPMASGPSSMSPLALYRSLPKLRNLTPNWKTMPILKMPRKNDCSVSRQGILFRNQAYWHEDLAWLIGSKVDILFNAPARKEDAPLSVTVIYQGRFVAEATPARHFPFIDADPVELQAHFDAKNSHKRELPLSAPGWTKSWT